MRARLLVFDPDIEGRRLLREALAIHGIELSLIMRASAGTAVDTLKTTELDGVLIGLPADLSALIPVFDQLQHLEHCPPLIFMHKAPAAEGPWLAKDSEGVRQLQESLPSRLRAYKLRRLIQALQESFLQVEGSARSHLATQLTATLMELDIQAMYVNIAAPDSMWKIQSSTFGPEVDNEIVTLTDAHGGVSTPPQKISGHLEQLVTGQIEDWTFEANELMAALLPEVEPEVHQRITQALSVSQVCALAVRVQDELRGLLLLGDAIQPVERQAFLELARQFGRMLEQAEEFDLMGQQARSMRALQDVMLSLSATLDPDDLIGNVLDKLGEVVPFDLAGILLLKNGELQLHASHGSPSDLQLLEQSIDANGGLDDLAGSLLTRGRPVLIESSEFSSRSGSYPLLSRFQTWMGVPVSWGTDQLGYIFLASRMSGRIEAIHLEIAVGFGRQLAVALKNAQLLQGSHDRAKKWRLVNDIGHFAVSVLDAQRLLEEVARRVCELFGYFAVRILLVEGEDLVLFASEPDATDSSVDVGEAIGTNKVSEVERVLEQDQLVQLNPSSPRWVEVVPEQLLDAQAAAFIPLSVASEVIGIMEVYAHSAAALTREDIDVLQVLAAQIAISIVNARLFNEIRNHAVELESRVEQRTQELQSQKERTEAILRSVADAILVLDLDGNVVLTNPAARELLVDDRDETLRKALSNLFAADGVVQSSFEVGEDTYQALASPVEIDGVARGTVIVLRNITSLKELDELKSQFVATVSHELRTPLTNIKLYLSLLRSAEEEKRSRYRKVLVNESERLSDMIEDLLNLSRLEAQQILDKENVQLASLLQTVAENHEPACESKDIEFSTDFSERPTISADPAQMIQVFTNLLANAVAYTPVGGEISLRIAGVETIEGQPYAKVVLRDTGIGIRKDDLPHIFDRFYRGSDGRAQKSEGSGLGLAIVREILDNHDAKIAVDSQPGRGTKFTVWLPASGE